MTGRAQQPMKRPEAAGENSVPAAMPSLLLRTVPYEIVKQDTFPPSC